MKLFLIVFIIFTTTLTFASASTMNAIRHSERSSTLKNFKMQMKSRLSDTQSRRTSHHRSSSTSHNNRFVHQNMQGMKQLSMDSSRIQGHAVNKQESYEKMYKILEDKYRGDEDKIHNEIDDYQPFSEDKYLSEDMLDLDEMNPFDEDQEETHGMSSRSILWRRR